MYIRLWDTKQGLVLEKREKGGDWSLKSFKEKNIGNEYNAKHTKNFSSGLKLN